jgi:hypothetical protein
VRVGAKWMKIHLKLPQPFAPLDLHNSTTASFLSWKIMLKVGA